MIDGIVSTPLTTSRSSFLKFIIPSFPTARVYLPVIAAINVSNLRLFRSDSPCKFINLTQTWLMIQHFNEKEHSSGFGIDTITNVTFAVNADISPILIDISYHTSRRYGPI